jgi:hypothetical protein
LDNIKDIEDFRVANRDAFKMEQVYKFNLGSCIEEYEYENCDNSDNEYSDNEEPKGEFSD